MAVGASAKVGRASPPGGQAHGASVGGFFVESGCTSSVAELAEKSALALPASGLSPGRGSYPTFMDRPSGTNFVQTPIAKHVSISSTRFSLRVDPEKTSAHVLSFRQVAGVSD